MNPDRVFDSAATKARGEALLATLGTYVKKREESILTSLVSNLLGGSLSENTMREGIAGIAALRSLLRDIERETRIATGVVAGLAAHKE
jgi:hypothetical protein